MLWRCGVLAGLAALGFGWAQDKTMTLRHADQDRTYLLHVPSGYDGSRALPLVLDFHGLTSTSQAQAFISGFRSQADKKGFLVAWPQGMGNSWNAGACCGSAQQQGLDDVGFARAVVAHVEAAYRVDARRVYVTGLSNGGAMTYRLASDASDLFAAAAVVSGLLVAPVKPARPIALISFHGYADKTVAYDGNGLLPSATAAVKSWVQADQCQAGPATVPLTDTSKCETWSSCRGGAEVSLCSIEGGHVLYQNDAGIDLAERAWAFLSRFSLPEGQASLAPRARAGATRRTSPLASYRADGRLRKAASRPARTGSGG